jgi:hypothetical protein
VGHDFQLSGRAGNLRPAQRLQAASGVDQHPGRNGADTAIIRPLFAMPFIIYAWKIIVWDKVLGIGVTEHGIDANFWNVFQVIIVSYFGATAIERVSRIFRR